MRYIDAMIVHKRSSNVWRSNDLLAVCQGKTRNSAVYKAAILKSICAAILERFKTILLPIEVLYSEGNIAYGMCHPGHNPVASKSLKIAPKIACSFQRRFEGTR